MKCRFVYNNQVFDSEASLDEYLLITESLKTKYGDAVFKSSFKEGSTPLRRVAKLLEDNKKFIEEAEKNGVFNLSESKGEPEDLDELKGKPGKYKTVTDLIHDLRRIDSQGNEHPMFPLFNPEEYWPRQFDKYRNGDYLDPKLQELLPFVEDLIPKIGDQLQPVSDMNILLKIRDRMESVWEQQARCGDLAHALFSDFFRAKTEDKKKFSSLNEKELVLAFKEQIKKEYYAPLREFATDPVLKSIALRIILINESIIDAYGEDCRIYSELKVVGQGIFEGNSIPVSGKLDLFVVSRTGKMAILDFKCSPKEYTEYNPNDDITKYDEAKILTFKYLLAAYRRLLKSIGISLNSGEITLGIVPVKFENFRLNLDTKRVEFDSISIIEENPIQVLSNTSALDSTLYSTIEGNLEYVFPTPRNISDTSNEEILDKVKEDESILFKKMKLHKDVTDDDIREMMKEKGGVKKSKITNDWEFRPNKYDEKDKITVNGKKSKDEAEIIVFEKLKKKYERKENYIPVTTSSIRNAFKEALEEDTQLDFSKFTGANSTTSHDPLWTQKLLGKYNDNLKYELVEDETLDPILDLVGILLFKNKYTGVIDIVKISNYYDPTMKAKLGGKNNTTLLGTFLSDELVNADSNSEAMTGIVGNVELMEVLLVLNRIPSRFADSPIGRIELLSPRSLTGLTAPNEQLLYNFKRLCTLGKIDNNFITNLGEEGILMLDHVSNCRETFTEILSSNNLEYGLGKINETVKSDMKSCISDFDNLGLNPHILREKLVLLDKQLVGQYPHLKLVTDAIQDENINPEYKLHRDILYAISQLSGVKLQLQIEDHAKILVSIKGISGTLADNPGTLLSKTLNEFTDLVTIAYLNVRDNVIAFNLELRKKVEALKKAKGFGMLQQYTTGNLVSLLYMNMYDTESEDLLFVNPWDLSTNLTDEERDFLKFAILKINDNRIKNFNPSNIELLIKLNPAKYLRVPLVKGDLSSEVAVRGGWLNFIRSRFMMLSPSRLKERFDRAANNLINETQQNRIDNGDMWEAINSFDASDGETQDCLEHRKNLLTSSALGGKSFFEHNLETLLLKHTSAYKMAEELNNIFPVLKALTIHLNAQGSILNKEFLNDLEYILKYVKTRIHNLPVENRKDGFELVLADVTRTIMSTTSKLTLAFNPRQWYQFIDGMWKDIQIYIKNAPEEGTPFTKEGLFFGWKKVFGEDLMHLGNDFTMSELLNLLYGFNDMDANSYIDRIKTDNTGLLYHFWDVGFRFASRPDFYNRMTLFYAQMHKDGSVDAHSIVDGKLVYDWKKDKRFEAFARGDKSDINKYNLLKSLFITMARLFEQEGVKNPDGTLYKMDLNNPTLPKAYTNLLSEGMKALSDRIYGYYAHEKKSMIHSSTVGALFMQMNTYWSAKKNQYAQTRSFTQEGDWVLYEEDGLKYYWMEDADGDLIPTTTNTGVPVQVWRGRPQEGIFLTAIELCKAVAGKSDLTDKSGVGGIRDLFDNENIDPQVRRLYSANMRQLISDLILWWIIGNLLIGSVETLAKEQVKKNKNNSLSKALGNTGIMAGASILKASTMDANFIESIFGRGKDWTPFAIKQTDRIASNLVKVGTGKLDLYDFLVKTSGAGNITKPTWDYVKINTLGRKIGDNGKEK